MRIWFDMDGTIADFYGVENWLKSLENGETRPYREAKPLVNMRILGKEIKRLQSKGVQVGIISWLSKTCDNEYAERITIAKRKWLERHIGSVQFDEIHIVNYGVAKSMFGDGILFDDEEKNRDEWNSQSGNVAFDVKNILEVLQNMG